MDQETVDAIVSIGRDNSNWGYGRIANFVHWLGYKVSFMTIKRILNEHGIFPTDGRSKSDIDQFYKAHENVLAACDFATYELLTENGLSSSSRTSPHATSGAAASAATPTANGWRRSPATSAKCGTAG